MKRYQIVLFLFGVIAALAVLCAVFPENGVLGLRFPRLGEVLSAAEPDSGPSPEELLEQRRQAILAAEKDQYQAFFCWQAASRNAQSTSTRPSSGRIRPVSTCLRATSVSSILCSRHWTGRRRPRCASSTTAIPRLKRTVSPEPSVRASRSGSEAAARA